MATNENSFMFRTRQRTGRCTGVVLALLLVVLLLAGACANAGPVMVTSSASSQSSTAGPAARDWSLAGRWTGSIELPGEQLLIVVTFLQTEDGIEGSMSVPAQGIPLLRLSPVVFEPPNLRFDVPGASASFEGAISGETISGQFSQSGVSGSFELTRTPSISD